MLETFFNPFISVKWNQYYQGTSPNAKEEADSILPHCIMVVLFPSDIEGESGFEWCHVLGGVYWAPRPKVRPRTGGPDKFAMLTTAPGEGQCPEDKPGEGSRPAEQGGHHQGPEQRPRPPDHREGGGTRLPAPQPSSAHLVRPVWGLHLGPVQAEPALH